MTSKALPLAWKRLAETDEPCRVLERVLPSLSAVLILRIIADGEVGA